MKRLELGVFLPIAKNGFLRSVNSPAYHPSYRDNLEITLLAEEIGLDYVFSMLKWRGFGGPSQFWDSSLDSFSLMAALAAMTKRVSLIATVNPILIHPTPMAKMAATIDDVSGGRLGLNLITGSTLGEYTQMGNLPPNYNEKRYAYASEWVHVLKRLWTESRVTHHGEYFNLEDCVSDPKPIQRPHPFLVCAGTSEEGLRFTAREANYSFLSGSTLADTKAKSRQAKAIAAEEHNTIKTATSGLIVLRDSRAEAEAYWEYLQDGVDVESTRNAGTIYSNEGRERNVERGAAFLTEKRKISHSRPILGTPADVAEQLTDLALEGEIDSIALVFPDYLDGLRRFTAVLPLLGKAFDVGVRAA